jgi:hypothetical protein
MARDITVRVAIEPLADGAVVIEIKVAGGADGPRADVASLVLEHLNSLWAELADRIKVAPVS